MNLEYQKNLPPNAIDAEQNVLGGLLSDPKLIDQVEDILSVNDFYHHVHKTIYQKLLNMRKNNKTIDIITVIESLKADNQLDEVGGQAYISKLALELLSISNINAYARIIKAQSVKRELISTANMISSSVYDDSGKSHFELLDSAEKAIFEINQRENNASAGSRSMKDILKNVIDRIDHISQLDGDISGLSTGISKLDQITTGLQNGDMIVIAGRPSMGKTTLAMNIVEELAINQNKSVGVFSLEMTAEQLTQRMLSSVGRIDFNNIRTAKLDPHTEIKRLSDATLRIAKSNLIIDDSSDLSLDNIRARARRMKREHKDLSLIVVDYLQLIKVYGMENRQLVNEIAEISRSMKMMAKELNIPIIVLSQLNRGLESRSDKRPLMSDLRESGSIEQDADLICFIYRDEVYNENSKDKGIAELIIRKQRNGPTGTVRVTFQGKYLKFSNLSTAYSQ